MTDPKASERKTIVERVKIRPVPPHKAKIRLPFEEGEEPEVVWEIMTTTRTGSLPSRLDLSYCISEEAANAHAQKFPVGREVTLDEIFQDNPDMVRELIDGRADPDYSHGFFVVVKCYQRRLAARILERAGLTNFYGQPSQEVADHLGRERIALFMDRFGENWTVAAVFEYCLLNFPRTSPTLMAAHHQYCHRITRDYFSAGYLLRDLEILTHGVEAQAMKSVEMRRKAGAMGSKASAAAREARRAALLGAMEEIARRNPDVARLGESALAELALYQCIGAEPSLWRQGKGQVMEYLGEIRRGEAGKEMQARHNALLGKKPPRRLG